jgi:hypothetical protein
VSESPVILVFPQREVVAAALDAYRIDPLGFVPTPQVWREMGMQGGASGNNEAVADCIRKSLLLEPTVVYGISTRYLPGPAAFLASNVRASIEGMPQAPTEMEIQNHQRSRILAKIVEVLFDSVGKTTLEVRIARAFTAKGISGDMVVATLVTEGLLVRHDRHVVPTEALQKAVGPAFLRRELVALDVLTEKRLTARQVLAAQREELFGKMKPELIRLVGQQPGAGLAELFREVQKLIDWPSAASRSVCEGFLTRLVADGLIEGRRKISYGVARGWTYHPVIS